MNMLGMKKNPDGWVRVGGLPQDPNDIISVMYQGMSGAGKTSLLRKMALDCHNRLEPVVILDCGDDWADYLRQKGDPRQPVREIDLENEGGAGISIAALGETPVDLLRLCQGLVPRNKADIQPYFDNAVALKLHQAFEITTHFAGSNYHLADPIRILKKRKLISLLGRLVPGVGDPWKDFGSEEVILNVMSDIQIKLGDLSIVAALMMHCTEFVDLKDPRGTIVIKWSDRFEEAYRCIMSFIFDAILDYRLSRKDWDEYLWLFLDEWRSLSPIRSLSAAYRRGRKHRVKTVVTFHEVPGVYDLYDGSNKAEEILGLMSHRVYTRQGSPMSAENASKCLGTPEVIEDVEPDAWNRRKEMTHNIRERANFTPDELRRLPLPDWDKDKITCLVDFPGFLGRVESPWRDDVTGFKVVPRNPRPPECQKLPPLTGRDLIRLNMPISKEFLDALN